MNPHVELESTRSLAGHFGEHFWGWEIPVYLFLGGLVAGLMMTIGALLFLRGKQAMTPAMRHGLVAAPVLLSVGMGALFLDLTVKLNVVRFYMTLRPTSPMSWGSWILMLVYPVQLLLVLALPCARLSPRIEAIGLAKKLGAWAAKHLPELGLASLIFGLALGLYTGLLLSTMAARPLWSSGALGALFLASGASTGVALLMLMERDHDTSALLARVDVALIVAELAVLGLWLAGLLSQGPHARAAAALVLWGDYAPVFVGFVVFGGLVVPALLELLALRGRAVHSRAVPSLVLIGGFLLRVVIVYAGQDVGLVRV